MRCTELRFEYSPRILQNEMEKSVKCATLVYLLLLSFSLKLATYNS